MIVYLNGNFIPGEQATVSVFDRGFRYGDGLFETLLVRNRKPFRWNQHLERLSQTAEYLRIPLRPDGGELRAAADKLLRANDLADASLRISVSRGIGPRGYGFTGCEEPVTVMTVESHEQRQRSEPYKLITSKFRCAANDPLRQHKTANRLLQVMAAAEARESGAQEALMLDTNGMVLECSSSNIFWIKQGSIRTAPVACGLLPGVTRALVLELCAGLDIPSLEQTIPAADLGNCDGVFLTGSIRGVVEVASIDGISVARSPITQQLSDAVRETIERECA